MNNSILVPRVKNTIKLRLSKIQRDSKMIKNKKISSRELDIIRTKLELKVCNEFQLDYATYCSLAVFF